VVYKGEKVRNRRINVKTMKKKKRREPLCGGATGLKEPSNRKEFYMREAHKNNPPLLMGKKRGDTKGKLPGMGWHDLLFQRGLRERGKGGGKSGPNNHYNRIRPKNL